MERIDLDGSGSSGRGREGQPVGSSGATGGPAAGDAGQRAGVAREQAGTREHSLQEQRVRALQALANGGLIDWSGEPRLPLDLLPAGESFDALRRAVAGFQAWWAENRTPADVYSVIAYHRYPETAKPLRQAVSAAKRRAAKAARAALRELDAGRPRGLADTPRVAAARSLARDVAALPGVLGVYVYGSVARGEDRPDSDVDLYVRTVELWRSQMEALARCAQQIEPRAAFSFDQNLSVRFLGQHFHVRFGRSRPSASRGFLDVIALVEHRTPAAALAAHRTHPAATSGGRRVVLWADPLRSAAGRDAWLAGVGELLWRDRLFGFKWEGRPAQGSERALFHVTWPHAYRDHRFRAGVPQVPLQVLAAVVEAAAGREGR